MKRFDDPVFWLQCCVVSIAVGLIARVLAG